MQVLRALRRVEGLRLRWIRVLIAILAFTGIPAGAHADEVASGGEAVDIERLQREIAEQQHAIQAQLEQVESQRRALEQQRQVLGRQQRTLERLQTRVSGASGTAVESEGGRLPSVAQGPTPKAPVAPTPTPDTDDNADASGTNSEPGAGGASSQADQTGQADQTDRADDAGGATSEETVRPNATAPLDQLLVEAGAVLLPQGVLQIEPGSEYTHAETNNFNINGFTVFEAIVIGSVAVDRIESDIFNSALNLRLGLFDRLQIEGRIPYPYRRERRTFGVGTQDRQTIDTDNWKLGDIDVGLLYQPPIRGGGWVPNLILNWRARFPTGEDPFGIGAQTVTVNQAARGTPSRPATGNGFYGLSQGFTTQWRLDPVVFFMGSSYMINFKDVKGGFGKINPGNTLNSFGGLNVAISSRVSLNFSFSDSYTFETRVNSRKQDGSAFNDARLLIGTSIGLNQRTNLIIAASAGLTDTSPDFQFTVRLPISFNLPIDFPDVPFLD